MFGLFSSRPPLTTRQRTEIDLLMRKAIRHIGAKRVIDVTVVERFSDLQLDLSSEESLLQSADAAVREQMKLGKKGIKLSVVAQSQVSASGCYQPGEPAEILIARETLSDPLRTVTTLAHEYAHDILISSDPNSQANTDEWLTDLVPICLGMGVLQSDATLYFEQWGDGVITGFSASKHGYLNAQQIGYALALFARFRDEANPKWSRQLRPDSRDTMTQAKRHFRSLARSRRPLLFDAEQVPGPTTRVRELNEFLVSADASFALAACWQLASTDGFEQSTIQALLQATKSSDEDLVPIAIQLLVGGNDADLVVEDRVRQLLSDRRPRVALAATKAAMGLGMNLKPHLGTLHWLLDEFKHEPGEVLQLIQSQGTAAESLDQVLCRMLARSINAVNDSLSLSLGACLNAVSTDPAKALRQNVGNGPVCEEALQWLNRSTQPHLNDH